MLTFTNPQSDRPSERVSARESSLRILKPQKKKKDFLWWGGVGGTVMDTLPCFPCDNWRRLLQLKRVCSLCRGAILNVQIPWLWFIAQLEGETFTPRTLAWQHTKCVSILELRPLLYINARGNKSKNLYLMFEKRKSKKKMLQGRKKSPQNAV